MRKIVPVVLAGGSGTRLWPLSRSSHPKQFIKITSENNSLFQNTFNRLPKKFSRPVVICNEAHRFIAAEQLREMDIEPETIILESNGKNTAPAIALAAFEIINFNPDAIMLVLASDHDIKNEKEFHQCLSRAKKGAEDNRLITFGIKPSRPDTNYGYIKANKCLDDILQIDSFKEKPSAEIAADYISNGDYFWNSGMFMFKAKVFLEELRKFEPEIFECCRKAISNPNRDQNFTRFDYYVFDKCPEKSIDVGVMERTNNGGMVVIDAQWSDLGTWESIWHTTSKNKSGNVEYGDIVSINSKNSLIYSPFQLTSVIGIENLTIVNTQDALLISKTDEVKNINQLLVQLKTLNKKELTDNNLVYRPWGYFNSISCNDNYQIKVISLNPGAEISLQKHEHRSEHWVVTSGIATVTLADKVFDLRINESTFIPAGEIHRLSNNQTIELKLIEIQTGDYLGEDDIIRFDDLYKRS